MYKRTPLSSTPASSGSVVSPNPQARIPVRFPDISVPCFNLLIDELYGCLDPFHTYMSLAVLSIYTPAAGEGEEPLNLRPLDVALNATIATAEWARRYMPGTG